MEVSKKKKNLIFSTLLIFMSILFSIFLIEMVLLVTGFSYKLYPETVEFGWPDTKKIKEMYVPDKELFWVKKTYNESLGTYRANNPDIIFMGCSCTEIGQYDQYFMNLVKEKYPEEKISSANFGVGGWSTYQGLQQLKRDVTGLKPKIITIYYGWNDHWIGFGIEDKDVKNLNSSFMYHFQKFRFTQLITKFIVALNLKKIKPERVSTKDFRKNLINMVNIARENDIIPVLLTAPTSHEKGNEPQHLQERWLRDINDLVPLHQEYISIVKDVARIENVILCDLDAVFKKLPRDFVLHKCFYSDGVHPRPEGDYIIAETLLKCFEENNLFEKITK